jgi:hypothetical protein
MRDDRDMATTAPSNTVTISFTQDEMNALRALTYAFQDGATLRRINTEHTLGLGANHIETIIGLHADLTGGPA